MGMLHGLGYCCTFACMFMLLLNTVVNWKCIALAYIAVYRAGIVIKLYLKENRQQTLQKKMSFVESLMLSVVWHFLNLKQIWCSVFARCAYFDIFNFFTYQNKCSPCAWKQNECENALQILWQLKLVFADLFFFWVFSLRSWSNRRYFWLFKRFRTGFDSLIFPVLAFNVVLCYLSVILRRHDCVKTCWQTTAFFLVINKNLKAFHTQEKIYFCN